VNNRTPDFAPLPAARLQFSMFAWVFLGAALLLAILPFADALSRLYDIWNLQPEYSHGVLIPPIALFLVWRQRDWLARTPFHGSWAGLPLVLAGLALWLVGELSTIYTILQYAFLLVLYGLVLSLTGWTVFKRLSVPLLILVFMVPLPEFFGSVLSLRMQLISSAIGVGLMRLAGVSVFLEGNVIDMGVYKLQVAEACSGLRYLFPLMILAFIVAYFFRAPFWKRAVLFLSSVPIAILMNSFRIGVIGITVEHWGEKMAQGMLHDFEGWMVFMLSTVVLLLIAVGLAKLGNPRARWRHALAIDFGSGRTARQETAPVERNIPMSLYVTTAVAGCAAVMAFALPTRADVRPARVAFADFPASVGEWRGHREALDAVYVNALQFDDYLLADFRRSNHAPINLYVAYYDSQRKGQSAHSPRSCLPGGGWNISSFGQSRLPGPGAMTVNHAAIEFGTQREVVYYWFQERGRVLSNEYLVKWYIFWDALTRNRTDGALVRLTASVSPGEDSADVEHEITQFAQAVAPTLQRFIPN
jgi:exosortase D (VPLPA-CTERM-specific)